MQDNFSLSIAFWKVFLEKDKNGIIHKFEVRNLALIIPNKS